MTAASFIKASARGLAAEHLPAVERWVLWLSALLLLGSILGGPRAELGALCGAGMSLLNARLVVALGGWVSRGQAETARRRLSLLLVLFQLKLGLLAALIYVTLRYIPVAPLYLLLGLSLLPLSICLRAIQYHPVTTAPGDGESRTAGPGQSLVDSQGAPSNHG